MSAPVSLPDLPVLLTIEEYALVMRAGVTTVRRELARGTCRVPPCISGGAGRKYLWRRGDVEHYLSTVSVVDDRRRRQSQLRLARG